MKKIMVLTLASLSLMTGLAGAAQATPGRTTNAPPLVPALIRNAEVSALTGKLAKLQATYGTRLSARELQAIGLKPVPMQLAARFNKLAKSNRTRAATVGETYWFTYEYYGQVWADVYYSGPFVNPNGDIQYYLYSNYKICDPQGNNCIASNVFTLNDNIDINGTYYYSDPVSGSSPDWAGFPLYGYGPYSG